MSIVDSDPEKEQTLTVALAHEARFTNWNTKGCQVLKNIFSKEVDNILQRSYKFSGYKNSKQ